MAYPLGVFVGLRPCRKNLEPRAVAALLPFRNQADSPSHLSELIASGPRLHAFVVHALKLAHLFEPEWDHTQGIHTCPVLLVDEPLAVDPVVSTMRRIGGQRVVAVKAIRVFAVAVVAAIAAVTGAVALAAPAHACSCARASEAEHFQFADVVFTGELIDRQEPPVRPVMSSGDPATMTFEVRWVHKGEAQRLQQVETAMSGASCGLEIEGAGPFLVFANQTRNGATLTASVCEGTRAISDGGPPAFGANYPPAPGGEVPNDSRASTTIATVVSSAAAVVLAGAGWVLVRHKRSQTRYRSEPSEAAPDAETCNAS